MKLSEISFPVFRLNIDKPSTNLGVVYYVRESVNLDSAKYTRRVRIVDDTSAPGNTLSRRRLSLKAQGAPLYSIKRAVFFLADLVKLSSLKHWWIDSQGKIFQYKKSTRAKLRSYKIEKIIPLNGIGAIIEVRGVPQRFKVLFKPPENVRYATIAESGISYRLLYGLTEEMHKDARRLI